MGDVAHYIEPFGGSMAVLLMRPTEPQLETVNDLNHHLINFWRAAQADPEAVARHAVNPLSEADLYARNKALVETTAAFQEKVLNDPRFYDVETAGWWVWGQSTLIGRPFAHDICKKMPSLLPMGVNSKGLNVELTLRGLADRLRRVRILCGDWKRCLGPTAIGVNKAQRLDSVGVFLDPPYVDGDFSYQKGADSASIWNEVRDWAIKYGGVKHIRIVLAGYEDGREMPEGWTRLSWDGHGGLGRKSKGLNANNAREVLWTSPHCLQAQGLSELYEACDLLGEED